MVKGAEIKKQLTFEIVGLGVGGSGVSILLVAALLKISLRNLCKGRFSSSSLSPSLQVVAQTNFLVTNGNKKIKQNGNM